MFDPSLISNLSLLLTGWSAAFVVALWLGLVFWTYRDIRSRSGDRMLQILAVLVVTILFLPGVIVYLVLRPQRTIEEAYQRALEEEALLHTIESSPHCPGCSKRVDPKWLVCPDCHSRLKKTCHHCSRLMELQWNICPYCATPAPGMKKESTSLDEVMRPDPVADESLPE
jgi:RNA polymerase subunit RPABC4/transcription elongation factor Spt4